MDRGSEGGDGSPQTWVDWVFNLCVYGSITDVLGDFFLAWARHWRGVEGHAHRIKAFYELVELTMI